MNFWIKKSYVRCGLALVKNKEVSASDLDPKSNVIWTIQMMWQLPTICLLKKIMIIILIIMTIVLISTNVIKVIASFW